jgi:ethanolamine utilization protein EutM
MMALGLVETKGLLAAVEAADAMLKTADVRLLEKSLVGGGLVTISIAGEVAAVRAAVDAAVVAIGRIQGAVLVSEHVIARPDVELARIVTLCPPAEGEPEPCVAEAPALEGVLVTAPAVAPVEPPQSLAPQPCHNRAQLKKMSLRALRQLALSLPGLSLSPDAVAAADKNGLIDAIINVYRQKEE